MASTNVISAGITSHSGGETAKALRFVPLGEQEYVAHKCFT